MFDSLFSKASGHLASAGEMYSYSGDAAASAVQDAAIVAIIVIALLAIALVALMLIATWKIFVKAGRPGWNALVPVYCNVVMLEFLQLPLWLVVLMFMPVVSIAVWILVSFRLARAFGKGAWFTVGLIFLPFIFYPILGFGSAQYQESKLPSGITEATKWTMIGTAALGILWTLSTFSAGLLTDSRRLSIILGGAGYATDGAHVYQYDEVIPGADPDSFTPLDEYYAVDRSSVYYEGRMILGADPSTFEILGDGSYAKDAESGFYDGRKISSDATAFMMPGNYLYAVDSTRVYFNGHIMLDADPATFTVPDPNDYYALDSANVYYEGAIIEGADVKTFEVELGSLGETPYDARDKNLYYYYGVDAREYSNMYQ